MVGQDQAGDAVLADRQVIRPEHEIQVLVRLVVGHHDDHLQVGDLAGELECELEEAMAGGASDGNTTSLYTATLDGLGAVGDGAHADHEHILVSLLPQRASLLAALLLERPLKRRSAGQ